MRALNMPVLPLRAADEGMSSGQIMTRKNRTLRPGVQLFIDICGRRESMSRPGRSPQRLMHSNVRPHHGEIQNLMFDSRVKGGDAEQVAAATVHPEKRPC